jgi:hypothetical protein
MGTLTAAQPTLTDFAGLAKRPELIAGLVFLEGTSVPGWTVRDLGSWFDTHVIACGIMARPLVVTEPAAGTVPLYPGAEHSASGVALLPKLLMATRIRVVGALRGLLDTPADDRFLASTIFAGRVRRHRLQGRPQWVARPEPTAPLSGIVLSMLAVDVLNNRDTYDRCLCVCDTCGRVSFNEDAVERRSCHEHGANVSGYVWKAVSRQTG